MTVNFLMPYALLPSENLTSKQKKGPVEHVSSWPRV